MARRILFFYAAAIAWVCCSSLAAANPGSLYPAGIVQGELPNGFRYILKENSRPGNRINFRLVMAIGSLQEQEGEEGAAHFIEHLAFRNTLHFPDGGIVRKLESLGEKYGVTINAYTGYDRTVYMFSIPSNTPGALELGVQIAGEWLSGISFTEKDIRNEKPVILEEIAGNSPSGDCFERLKKGSDIRLHRLPVGTPEQVLRITPQVLKAFYARNYQAQEAGLIIVGAGVDTTKAKKAIEGTFGKLSGDPSRKMKARTSPLTYKRKDVFKTCIDKDNRNAAIEWIYPVPATPVLTRSQVIADEKNKFVLAMLNTRLLKKGNALRVSKKWYLNGTEHLCMEISEQSDSLLLKQFMKGISILEGVRRNGFSEQERAMQLQAYAEKNKNFNYRRTSEEWCEFFTDILLAASREVMTPEEGRMIFDAMANMSLKEWDQCLAQLLRPIEGTPLVACRFSPQYHKKFAYEKLLAVFSKARQRPDTTSIPPPPRRAIANNMHGIAFLNQALEYSADEVESLAVYPHLGLQAISLKNGAQLLLKPIASADSMLSVTLLFRGGLSSIPQGKYPLLEGVASYMSLGGVKGIGYEAYGEALEMNSLSVINTMEAYWHGMMASGKSDKLGLLANLILQRCFHPEKRYADFNEIKSDLRKDMQGKDTSAMSRLIAGSPERMLRKRIDELTGNTLPGACELTAGDVEKLNLDTIAGFYHDIYTNSTGLTCLVAGNFEPETAKRAFISMLSRFRPRQSACLPAGKKELTPNALFEKVSDGVQPGRMSFDYLYRGLGFPDGLRQVLVLKLIRELIRNRVIDEIRNNSGLIYSPYVDVYYQTIPAPAFCFDVNGTISSKNALTVKSKIDKVMKQLQEKVPGAEELEAVKQSFLLAKNSSLGPDALANWREYLTGCIKEKITFADAEKYETILNAITPEEILLIFQKLIKTAQKTFLYTGDLYENKN